MNERVKTQNGCGWTTDQSNPITDEMLKFIAASESPTILDIGAAYGVATLPALRAGATVVANDIEPSHLVDIARMASQENLEGRLTTQLGRFPFVRALEELDAIHCSNVLHFLSGKELLLAFSYARHALLPGGKIFIQVGTPYAGHVRKFFPIYEGRLLRGDAWPGEIDDTRLGVKYLASCTCSTERRFAALSNWRDSKLNALPTTHVPACRRFAEMMVAKTWESLQS